MISENKPNESTNETRKWLESYLSKIMKIKITDGRVLIGTFLCTDKNSNVILGSCQEHLNSSGINSSYKLPGSLTFVYLFFLI